MPGPGGAGDGTTASKSLFSKLGSGLLSVLGGPIGGLVGSLGSSLLGNRGAKKRQQLADQQNIKFWNMQNAYNTPKQQMSRLKDAGLNPNLIYGSNANTGVAGSVSPSKASPYSVQNPVPSAIQTALITSQIQNLNSVTEKNRAETEKTLGLTPSLINRSNKQLEILVEQKLQASVKSGQISKQQVATTKKLMADATRSVQQQGYEKTYINFKKGLIKAGIDPAGSLNTTALKWFVNLFKNNKPTGSFNLDPQLKN